MAAFDDEMLLPVLIRLRQIRPDVVWERIWVLSDPSGITDIQVAARKGMKQASLKLDHGFLTYYDSDHAAKRFARDIDDQLA